jgi:myosin heavy subunit
MAITQNDVFVAADQIVANGANPTLASVRKLLGGGSFTTISEWMNDWKMRKQTPLLREPAPDLITQQLGAFASELWVIAQDMANARLKTEREALDATRLELEQVSQDAVELADQLSNDLEETQIRMAAQERSLQKLTLELSECATENASLIERLNLQTSATDIAQASLRETKTRADQLSTLLEQEREERRAAEQRAAAADKQAAVLEDRLARLAKTPG